MHLEKKYCVPFMIFSKKEVFFEGISTCVKKLILKLTLTDKYNTSSIVTPVFRET